jgi:hypothetical protein
MAPGRCSDRARCAEGDSEREPELCAYHALLAHAEVGQGRGRAVSVHRGMARARSVSAYITPCWTMQRCVCVWVCGCVCVGGGVCAYHALLAHARVRQGHRVGYACTYGTRCWPVPGCGRHAGGACMRLFCTAYPCRGAAGMLGVLAGGLGVAVDIEGSRRRSCVFTMRY